MTEPFAPLRIIDAGPARWALVGDLDAAETPKLEACLAGWDGDVVLDCSGLTFVDASGLGLLVRTRAACETRGRKLTLVAPSCCLLRLLAITGLDDLLLTSISGSEQ